MNVKKFCHAEKSIGSSLTLNYYTTIYEDSHGNVHFGACIESAGPKSVEEFLAPDIFTTQKEATLLIEKLSELTVTPRSAHECIDELLAA